MPRKIIQGFIATAIVLITTINLPAQNYKLVKEKDAINKKAAALVKEAFIQKDVAVLFDKSFICGPNLWAFISKKTDTAIEGLDANFHIMQPDKSYKTVKGKVIQTIDNAKKVWLLIASNHTNFSIRKPKNDELSMYASLLSPTITEPIYVVNTTDNSYLIHIDNRNLKIMVMEKLN